MKVFQAKHLILYLFGYIIIKWYSGKKDKRYP